MSGNNRLNNNIHKICILGDGGCGKTSLIVQYTSNHFVEYYDPTIEDSYRKQLVVDEQACLLDILDTAGQEELSCMMSQWIRSCSGFVVVYSITSRSSFDQVNIFRDQISRVLDRENIPMILVGNKCDQEELRQVTTQEGQDLANCLGMLHIETSAKTRLNIEDVFYNLVRKMRESEKSFSDKSGDKDKKPTFKSMVHKMNKIKKSSLQNVCKIN
ncbi:hypothetical protein CYY_004231 [Polysphondylium violaceum]|uniref:small monomeric GTPase n=1 Tax=Polysphondylium violaceum TaxID=133409 RepID=A0A8J4PXB8_9MYCE|nr:hypothetical protein CYY_004231 [Polysphondylium violaceum]